MQPTDNPGTPTPPAAPAGAPQRTPQQIAQQWLAAIKYNPKAMDDFEKRGDRITKRYKQINDSTQPVGAGSKFNIFWANVDTLLPATYSRRPMVEVYRRFADQDPVGRLAATILQRALQYEIDCNLELHQAVKSAVLDRLLPGRGVVWVRYEAEFEEQSVETPVEGTMETKSETVEEITDERSVVDYVYWKDFRHGPGRVWADVPWVARRLMFTKEKLQSRFGSTMLKLGGDISTVVCTYDPSQPQTEDEVAKAKVDTPESLKRAMVWEIWDRDTKQAIWVAPGAEVPLDIVDDPTELRQFFPVPKPLFGTMTNDEVVPVADYIIYRDQIRELDTITNRISLLVSALRVVGVYDASQPALQNLLSSGQENRMVPVNQWAAFAEKGGLKGVTDFLPLDQIVKVLEGLYTAREQVKQTVYELTGMADIIRGASKASETLGAQQIKSKFANLRLSSRQGQVAEFVTGVLQIKAEMVCNLYSPETILRISAADQISEAIEHPERVQQAIAMLKDEKLLHYRIEVASDSMLEPDEAQERERRNDFMSTVANFMNAVKNIAEIAPEMMPVALEMLKFTVRGFSVGRSLESAIDDAADKVKKRLANPPPAEPSDAQVKKELEQFKQKQETLRTLIKEDGAQDREELKASLALALQNLENKLMGVLQGAAAGGELSDQDQGKDFAQMSGALNPPPPPQQPPMGPPGMMPSQPQGAPNGP